MNPINRKIVILELSDGKSPFSKWFRNLKDKRAKVSVVRRLTRLSDGNFGDHKGVGHGVFELRIHYGGGLRVYYGLERDVLVIILFAGNKASQKIDIAKAKVLWRKYQNENS